MASTSAAPTGNVVPGSPELLNENKTTPPGEVVKVYPQRGPWTQYRLAASTTFTCTRCKKQKKAKLVAIKETQWENLLCNGCYGFLLSRK
ncbi:hypothetical protein EV426DRAFT_606579 [Tirmania nivea]|nr:hypothetical protein EV426DRAFT_606579 [Tirmania nivea]